MYKYLVITALFIFASCKQPANEPVSDKLFMGIKGPVKQYTTTMYKKVAEKDGKWLPIDTGVHSGVYRYTCYFSTDGYMDSLYSWSNGSFYNKDEDKFYDSITLSRAVPDIKNRKRMEHLFYEGSILTGTVKDTIVADSSISKTYSPTGILARKSITVLGKNQCPEINIYIQYDSLGNEMYKKTQRWKRDENCNVISVEETDGKETKTYNYKIVKTDSKYSFSLETQVTLQGESKPEKIYIRSVEYY